MQGTPERIAAGSAEEETHAPWVWVGAEAVVIRGMLRALHGHCITELTRGWTALERTACHLRHVQSMRSLLQFCWPDMANPASRYVGRRAITYIACCFNCCVPTVVQCSLPVLYLRACSSNACCKAMTRFTIKTPMATRQLMASVRCRIKCWSTGFAGRIQSGE